MSWLKEFCFKHFMVTVAQYQLRACKYSRRTVWYALVRVAAQHPDEEVSQWILRAHRRLAR